MERRQFFSVFHFKMLHFSDILDETDCEGTIELEVGDLLNYISSNSPARITFYKTLKEVLEEFKIG